MRSHRGLIIVLCVLIGLLAVLMKKMGAKQNTTSVVEPTIAEQRRADLMEITNVKAHNWQLDAKLKTIKTHSGLKYQDISAGGGSCPKVGDTVLVDYVGWSANGRRFDTSLEKGREPLPFVVGRGKVIKGWDEGVMTMRIGGIRRLVIPSDLAYGEIGAPPDIMPNETLVFMVKLIDITPAKM
jgi:peptidylprolyl isomerase